MKRYEGALRRLSILFILINLLSPLSAATTTAQDQTTESQPVLTGSLQIRLYGDNGNIPGGSFSINGTTYWDSTDGDDGYTTVTGLPAGDVTVYQVATGSGYVFDASTPYTANVPADGTGTLDVSNAVSDADSDGTPDLADVCNGYSDSIDTDLDGTPDGCDLTPNGDADIDGVDRLADNCPDVANPNQEDLDGDTLGDACDPDIDGDTVANESDMCLGADDTVNVDKDTTPDCIDDLIDSDGDGVADDVDVCQGQDDTVDVDKDGRPDCIDDEIFVDSDGDGLSDDEEATLKTDPANADTDGDGVNDGDEVKAGTNPLVDETATPVDTDNDGLTDDDEAKLGTDPAKADTDADGLNDGDEVKATTDPLNADTDGDGLNDGDEVAAGRDPLKPELASLAVTQTVAPESAAVDDVVTFTITITNNGQLPVENIAIANSLKGLSGLTCDPADLSVLAPGTSITCSATYQISKQDENAGSVANTVTVTSDNAKVDPVAAEVAIGAQVMARSIVAQAAAAAVTVDFAAYTPGTYNSSTSSDNPTGGTVESLTPGGFVQCGSYLYYQALVTAASSGDFTFGYIFDSQSGTGWTLTYSAPVRVEIYSQSGSGNVQLVANANGTYTLTGLEEGDVVEILMVTKLLCLGTNPVTGQVNVAVQFNAQGIGKQTVPLKGRGEDLQAALGITKSGPASVQPGGNVTYTITVFNTGNAAAENVVVMDNLPAGVTWSTNKGSIASNVLTYTIASLAAGTSETITISGTVPVDGSVCSLTNVARIEQGDNDILSNEVVTTVNCQTNVSITKTGPATLQPGDTVTYTITVTNNGTINATNVLVTDNLPSGITWSTDKGSITDGTLSHTVLTLAPKASEVITVTGDVPLDGSVCAFTNTASFSFSGGSGTSSPAVVTTVNCQPNVNITKSSNPETIVQPGGALTWFIGLTNTGSADATDITVSDTLPVGFEIGLTPTGCTYDAATRLLTCTVTVPKGTTSDSPVTISVPGSVANDGSVCSLSNTASAAGKTATDTVSIDCKPNVSITKSVATTSDPTGATAKPGDTVTYTITIKNTGTADASNVLVQDTLPAGIAWQTNKGSISDSLLSYTIATLVKMTGTETITVTGVIPLDGNVCTTLTNTASFSFTGGSGTSSPATSTRITCSPGLTILKTSGGYVDANTNGRADAGEKITYTVVVTNTGNTTLTNIAVADAVTGNLPGTGTGTFAWNAGTVLPIPSIPTTDPDSSVTLKGSYTLTQADIDSGATLENCATASVGQLSQKSCASDTIEGKPAWTITKTSAEGTFVDVNQNQLVDKGDTISYQIVVKNTGNTTLTNLVVTDPLTNGVTPVVTIVSLIPNATVSFGVTYTLTQADVDAGSIKNCAYATLGDKVVEGCDTDTIPPTPRVDVVKESVGLQDTNGNGRADAGEMIRYKIVVTNTGNTTLTNISVTDELKVSSVVIPNGFEWEGGFTGTIAGPLAPNGQVTLYGTYEITQGDLDTTGGVVVLNCATATVGQATDTSCDDDIINGVRLVDAAKNSGGYTDTNGNGRADAGETITYTIVVTNNGSTTLKDVLVGDLLTGTALPGAITWLDGFDGTIDQINVGGAATAVTVTASYTLTQQDIDGGVTVQNCVDVTGDTNDANDCVTDKITSVPGVDAAKTSGGVDDGEDNILNAGDTIHYTIVVTNTGNTTLTNVAVADIETGGNGNFTWDAGTVLPIPTIAVGDSVTLHGTYTITQADLDTEGGVTVRNCVDVDGDGNAANDCVTDTVTGTPGVDAAKTSGGLDDADTNGRADAGETITYTIEVTNTGNTTLKDVVVGDELTGTALPGTITWLDGFDGTIDQINVGDSETVKATYTLTQDDIDAGVTIQNCVVVSTDPTSTNNCVKDTVEGVPGLALDKVSETVENIGLGDEITYDFAVTNTGNVTLYNVAVDDPMLDAAGVTVPTIDQLDPGQTVTVSGTYTVTQADVDEGFVYNCATATAGETTSNQDCLRIDIPQTAALAISKTCPDPATVKRVGDEITYQVTVTNSGNVTVYDIVLDDARDGTFGDYPTTLAPGEDFTVEFTTTITSDDAINGNLDNSVTVTGTALLENEAAQESGIPVVFLSQENGVDHSNGKTAVTFDETATITCPYVPATGLVIEKTSDKVEADDVVAGTKITYSFAVTNTGDTTLNDVVINDDLEGLVWDDAFKDGMVDSIEPGKTVIATATYVVTDADVAAGHVLNCATATSGDIESNESCVDVPTDAHPALAIIKTATPVKVTKAGEVITYTFVVTNTGNVPLEDVVVVDEMLDKAGVEIPPIGDLKPGETKTVTAQYTVTEADMKLDAICNTAVATDGTTTSEPDTATVTVVHPKPAPAPTKLPNTGSGDGATGQDGLWMIAATGAAILAAGALGLRKRAQM